MLTVSSAIDKILYGIQHTAPETVAISDVSGRVCACDVQARLTQPPFRASAMDGYAVQFEGAKIGQRLKVIGHAPAGAPFDGKVGAGEAVRIFTGGVVPDGADHVIIQEDVTLEDGWITVNAEQPVARNIRVAGVDFKDGDVLTQQGDLLHDLHGSIFASANIDRISVRKKPRVAIFSNGDELVEPGTNLSEGQIVNSNHYALSTLIHAWGGEPTYLGCVQDDEDAIVPVFERAVDYDVIVPIGGASVGDYDFVKSAFGRAGGNVKFEKVAVRPGKPTWCGDLNNARVVGLPGNPASALVTAVVFLRPLICRLLGLGDDKTISTKAKLNGPVKPNGRRETYLRGLMTINKNGNSVSVAPNQDSSLLSPFLKANVLIRRPIDAPALDKGDDVDVLFIRQRFM